MLPTKYSGGGRKGAHPSDTVLCMRSFLQGRDDRFSGSSTVYSWPLGAIAGASLSGVVFLALVNCTRPPVQAPVTLTLVEQSPGLDESLLESRSREFEDFHRETGVLVQSLPTPESADDQLLLWQR